MAFNTIILKEGTANLTNEELKKFNEGDTIYGNNSNPVEIARWNISDEKQARAVLADYRCSYDGGRIKEYALEFCETDEDGEFVSGSDYDFAPEEKTEGMRIHNRAITQADMDIIANYMNDEICEAVHRELAPCEPEEFLERYLELDPDFEDVLRREFGFEN